jgi:hypothetical protein
MQDYFISHGRNQEEKFDEAIRIADEFKKPMVVELMNNRTSMALALDGGNKINTEIFIRNGEMIYKSNSRMVAAAIQHQHWS